MSKKSPKLRKIPIEDAESPHPKPILIMHTGSGPLQFFRERAKRITKCQMCSTGIKKGEWRIKQSRKLREPMQTMRGGTMFKDVRYYHPECLARVFLTGGQSGDVCSLCQHVMRSHAYPRRKRSFGGVVRVGTWQGTVCHFCATDFVKCRRCKDLVPESAASPSLVGELMQSAGATKVTPDWYCNRCIDVNGITNTVRSMQREQRATERLWVQYDRIAAKLAKEGL